jgi:hypothetical protein
MAYNTPSAVHFDAPLTNLTLAWMGEQRYVHTEVFPVVNVAKQSDLYYKYDPDQIHREGDVSEIAPRTEVPEFGLTQSTDNYFARVYGLGASFDDQMLANEDTQLETRSVTAQALANKIMLERERRWASTFFVNGVWGINTAGVSGTPGAGQVKQWSSYTDSNPILDITNMRRSIQLASYGYKPNTMVIGKEARDILINHPQILARLNGGATVTNTALVTDAKLAEIFEVEKFLTMETVSNTAAEGLPASKGFIGGKSALLAYTPPSAGLMTPAAGLTFAWNSIPGANWGMTVESFTGDWLRIKGIAEKIQVKYAYDMKLVGPQLGGFFNTIVA